MDDLEQQPAIEFKKILSKPAYDLLNKLILDLYSTIKNRKIVYKKDDNSTLIYNLFNCNKYSFNYKIYKEIFNVINK